MPSFVDLEMMQEKLSEIAKYLGMTVVRAPLLITLPEPFARK
jgi:hypothetical protein